MWIICFAFNIFLEDSHLLSLCINDLVCISGNHVHVRYAGQRVTTVLRLPGVLLHSARLQPAAAHRELTQVLFLLIGMLRLSRVAKTLGGLISSWNIHIYLTMHYISHVSSHTSWSIWYCLACEFFFIDQIGNLGT